MLKGRNISIVLPVYNAEKFLSVALRSLTEQTFGDFELIAINDGSTDSSFEILQEFASLDPRIRVLTQENRGLIDTLNRGVEEAEGELICRFDADDFSEETRLEKQFQNFEEDPELVVLGCQVTACDRYLNPIGDWAYPIGHLEVVNELEHRCPFPHPGVIFRKAAFETAGGYRKAFPHCEDYDLWFRMKRCGGRMGNHPDRLLRYRIHADSVSRKNRQTQLDGGAYIRACDREVALSGRDCADGVEHFRQIKETDWSHENRAMLRFDLWKNEVIRFDVSEEAGSWRDVRNRILGARKTFPMQAELLSDFLCERLKLRLDLLSTSQCLPIFLELFLHCPKASVSLATERLGRFLNRWKKWTHVPAAQEYADSRE